MPGGNPADESPGVIAPLSQLGHGRATDLKSANAINRDRPVSRQLLDPTRERGGSVHDGPRQHVDASGQVLGQTEIEKDRPAIIVTRERGLQFLGYATAVDPTILRFAKRFSICNLKMHASFRQRPPLN